MVTQCPIMEGQTFRYSFLADTSGTYFYHSHDGKFIVILFLLIKNSVEIRKRQKSVQLGMLDCLVEEENNLSYTIDKDRNRHIKTSQ